MHVSEFEADNNYLNFAVYIKTLIMNLLKFILRASVYVCLTLVWSCKDDEDVNQPAPRAPQLVFKFVFDSTQVRLDGFGIPSAIPAGHGAQSPVFNKMSAHYIELTPDAFTSLGGGEVLYHHEETTAGGATAIDFSKSNPVGNNEIFYSMPISQVTPGTYEYLRVSLAYQNYDIKVRATVSGTNYDFTGTLASFIGYNTYINSYKIKDSTVIVGANKLQGYWAFESPYGVTQGQAPAGATTVPNPIFSTSPIPQGSCVVTGVFASPLSITGNETSDVVITVSVSTNKSFEWVEHSAPGYYEPLAGDTVVDMGVRGIIPSF